MRLPHRLSQKNGGWTIIELIITVAIIVILYSVVSSGVETLKGRVRMAQIKADIDRIKNVAYNDFTNDPNNEWADFPGPGVGPDFVGGVDLDRWPIPPCPGWMYSWDDFFGVPGVQAVRITVRRADFSSIWSFCLENYGGDCAGDDGFGGNPPELSATGLKHAYCNE